jgi:hypothetical protein
VTFYDVIILDEINIDDDASMSLLLLLILFWHKSKNSLWREKEKNEPPRKERGVPSHVQATQSTNKPLQGPSWCQTCQTCQTWHK